LIGFGNAIVGLAILRQGLSPLCLRFIGIDSIRLAHTMAPVIPVMILTALPMIALRVFVNGEHGLLSIAVGTATCAMTWLGAVYLLRRALPAEIDLVRAQVLGRLVGARAQ